MRPPLRWAAAAGAVLALAAPCAQAQILYTYAQPVAMPTMSDEDLAYTVARAFEDDDMLKGKPITLRVVDHKVVVEGIVFSTEQVKQARAVAEYAVGPERVVMDVEIAR